MEHGNGEGVIVTEVTLVGQVPVNRLSWFQIRVTATSERRQITNIQWRASFVFSEIRVAKELTLTAQGPVNS